MEIGTTRFGRLESIEVAEDQILTFAEGIVGFEALTKFARIRQAEYAPFEWLQSTEDADVSFVVADPAKFFPNYSFELGDDEVQSIDLAEANEAEVLTILVVPENPQRMTANLVAPLVVNRRNNLARQIVLNDQRYSIRTPLFPRGRRNQGREVVAAGNGGDRDR